MEPSSSTALMSTLVLFPPPRTRRRASRPLTTVLIAARHTRNGHPQAMLCVIMPNPFGTPVPQRSARREPRRLVSLPHSLQLPMQHWDNAIMRAQRRMPLRTGTLIATTEREHAQPFFGVPLQRGDLFSDGSSR